MKSIYAALLLSLAALGCGGRPAIDTSTALAESRKGFASKLEGSGAPKEAVPQPPPNDFQLVSYDAPAGKLAAYLTPDSKDGKKHPAIVWITGGDCNSIGDVWSKADRSDDQTARAYREAGIVMMFPSLRGGNNNPGSKEGFLGEVDDVLAAADFLARQEYVNPERIYLGGHSTGGTLVLLVAEISPRFRAVFSFGPVDDVSGYGKEYLPFSTSGAKEIQLRSPIYWLHCIKSPVFVLEGDREGNVDSVRAMAGGTKNSEVRFFVVKGANHFSVLAPVNEVIARKILADDGPKTNVSFTQQELNRLF